MTVFTRNSAWICSFVFIALISIVGRYHEKQRNVVTSFYYWKTNVDVEENWFEQFEKSKFKTKKFYGEDPLHMNVLGYSLLSKLIRDELSLFNN